MSNDATIRPHREEIVRLLCAYAAESLRVTDTWAAAHGITGTDVRAMAHLGDARPGGMPVTAGRLGTALGLSSPATSALIARLESGGHVTRARDPKDRRRVLLTASPSAKRGAAAYFQPMGNAVTAALAEFNEDETAVIATFLARLVKEMNVASRA